MNRVFAAALEVERALRERSFRFCFIGGLAVQRWGTPRMTADVDVTLVTGFGGEAPYVDALLARFPPRITDARAFALRHRTLLLAVESGVHVDISLGAMPFEERTVERASAFALAPGRAVTTCSAEDLVVHKAFAGRAKDWLDVEGIVERQRGSLREQQIWDELLPLLELKEDAESQPRLRALLARSD